MHRDSGVSHLSRGPQRFHLMHAPVYSTIRPCLENAAHIYHQPNFSNQYRIYQHHCFPYNLALSPMFGQLVMRLIYFEHLAIQKLNTQQSQHVPIQTQYLYNLHQIYRQPLRPMEQFAAKSPHPQIFGQSFFRHFLPHDDLARTAKYLEQECPIR